MKSLLLLLAFIPLYGQAATDTRCQCWSPDQDYIFSNSVGQTTNTDADTLHAVDTSAIQELYEIIAQKKPAGNTDGFRWEHRRILYQALGIDPAVTNDSAAAVRLRFGWQQLQRVRISRESEPPFYFREILRLAVHHGYGVLLLDAARWKVDLNSFDPVSHTSLLDYLEEEYRNSFDEKRLGWLREYKQVLQNGGAEYFVTTNYKMQTLAKKYDRIRPPVDGLFPVQRTGRWGWVTANNSIVIPLKYVAVRYFTREYFEVSDNGIRFRVISKIQAPAKLW